MGILSGMPLDVRGLFGCLVVGLLCCLTVGLGCWADGLLGCWLLGWAVANWPKGQLKRVLLVG